MNAAPEPAKKSNGRRSDYFERSAKVEKEIEALEKKSRLQVRNIIAVSMVDAVEELKYLMSQGLKEESRIAASKHILKLGGLEVEQHEHSGKNGSPILVEIKSDHAKKIREAASR